MALSYPHRQTIIIGVICLVAIAAVAFYTQRNKAETNDALGVQASAKENTRDVTLTATSTNWQKDFFTVSTSTKSTQISKSGNTTSPTLTDTVGKDFFTRFMVLKQAGQTTDQESVKNAMDQTIANAAASAAQPKIYSLSNIKISTDTSLDAIHMYANTVGSTLLTNISRQDPTEIAMNALDRQNMDELKNIDPIISGYQKAISELLLVNVPQDLASSHVGIINGLSILLYVSQGLRRIQEDSMQSMVSLGLYTTGQDTLRASLLDTQAYLQVKNVPVLSTEPGYLFLTITK